MNTRIQRIFATASAVLGTAVFAIGAWSCVTDLAHNVGPFSLTDTLSVRVHRGVVAIRQITGYELPVTLADWRNIAPVAHPERIIPTQPSFPWLGYFNNRQVGIAVGPSDHSDQPFAEPRWIAPANTRIFFFPIWLLGCLFFLPVVGAPVRRLIRRRTRIRGGYRPEALPTA